MDQIDELLEIGITEKQAESVLTWHKEALESEKQAWGSVIISRILSYLLCDRHKDNTLRIRAIGMAFGWGLGKLTGHPSPEAASRAEGCSSMAISKASKEAKIALGFKI
jgi:hypothetical protein